MIQRISSGKPHQIDHGSLLQQPTLRTAVGGDTPGLVFHGKRKSRPLKQIQLRFNTDILIADRTLAAMPETVHNSIEGCDHQPAFRHSKYYVNEWS